MAVPGGKAAPAELLQAILNELKLQNSASKPIMRAASVTDVGKTLDWSAEGIMTRIVMRNKGPNSAWYSYDIKGPGVDAFTSNASFEIQAQESINLTATQFSMIGLRCAAGQTAVVHAQAWKSQSGTQSGSMFRKA